MTTTITGAAITTATVAATTSVTTDLIQYDTAKDEAGGFTKQQVVQIKHVESGVLATGTTVLPDDDTIPQITEGDEYYTLAITPKSASNILIIDVILNSTNSAQQRLCVALFQDTTAAALASQVYTNAYAGSETFCAMQHKMVAGTTSETTFRIRQGALGGTNTINGRQGGRLNGGNLSSTVTITEYTP
jgi:hypothetical protein|tara:strand:+ start:60 stop:626 length:567 start_codon:yes stop_codon:yes gene_type:complete